MTSSDGNDMNNLFFLSVQTNLPVTKEQVTYLTEIRKRTFCSQTGKFNF